MKYPSQPPISARESIQLSSTADAATKTASSVFFEPFQPAQLASRIKQRRMYATTLAQQKMEVQGSFVQATVVL